MGEAITDLYTRHLRRHDRDLYAARNKSGVICVYRKGWRYEPVLDSDELTLYASVFSPQYVLALTDTWKTNGAPCEWGVDRLLERVREIDLATNPDLLVRMEKENEKRDESKARDFRNETESMLYESRDAFKKAFNDINTSTLSKDDARRRRRDLGKEVKYGNR